MTADAEVGEAGAKLQGELVQACRNTGFALVGPNCIGVINTAMPGILNFASFMPEVDALLSGDVSMVSQSGGLATMTIALLQRAGIGFRLTIGSGNEAVLGLPDYIHALARQSGTRITAVYLEGVRDGPRFRAALDAARQAGKPVVIRQGGRTEASAKAAAAHSGTLATPRRIAGAAVAAGFAG